MDTSNLYSTSSIVIGTAAVALCSIVYIAMSKLRKPVTAQSHWNVDLNHGPLTPIAERLWKIVGSLKGMSLPRTMLIYRLSDNSLLIHSPVCVNEETMTAILELGPISHIIIPNSFHTLDAVAFATKFNEALILCPEESVAEISKKVPNIPINSVESRKESLANLGLSFNCCQGVKPGLVGLVYRLNLGPALSPTSALVCTDLFFNLPEPQGFMDSLIGHRLLDSTGKFKVTRIFRWFVLTNKDQFTEWVKQLKEECVTYNVSVFSVAHGTELIGADLIQESLSDVMTQY